MNRCYVTEPDYRRWFTPDHQTKAWDKLLKQWVTIIGPIPFDAFTPKGRYGKTEEPGDHCLWCGKWYGYDVTPGPYCQRECAVEAERD